MGHKRNTLMAAILVLLVGLLVGCSQTSVRLGWMETSLPGHVKATFAEFAGTETRTVLAQPGETHYPEYDAEVDHGSLYLEVDDPCGETTALSVYRAGCYTISVQGEATEWGFDLKWEQN